jgi:hypothetical protein
MVCGRCEAFEAIASSLASESDTCRGGAAWGKINQTEAFAESKLKC